MYEVGSGNGPALGDLRERHGAPCREVEVVCSAEGEVGKEFEVAYTVGAELKVGGGNTVGWRALEGLEVVEVDGARKTECFKFALDFGAVERLARWECDTSCSVVDGVLVCRIQCPRVVFYELTLAQSGS